MPLLQVAEPDALTQISGRLDPGRVIQLGISFLGFHWLEYTPPRGCTVEVQFFAPSVGSEAMALQRVAQLVLRGAALMNQIAEGVHSGAA